jgi:hypothetical protein
MENRFIVKCDECKAPIKLNATQRESMEGGLCAECKRKHDAMFKKGE